VGECFFWNQPTRVVPDKGPLNGCVCVCVFDRLCIHFLTCLFIHPSIHPLTHDSYFASRTKCGIALVVYPKAVSVEVNFAVKDTLFYTIFYLD